MKVITYSITLQEPTLVTAPGGDPNGATALDYLPGSVLRGAIIGKYAQQQRGRNRGYQLDPAETTTRRLFFNGSTRFLNGYLLVAKQRALPAPLSWHRQKGKESPARDLAVEPLPPDDRKTWQGVDRRKRFCIPLGEASVRLVQAERHLAVHTARNRRLGRPQEAALVGPDEDPGALYRYESLAAGQTFSAAILCDEHTDTELLLPLVEGPVALGGARNGGYGWAQLQNAQIEDAPWSETDSPGQPTPEGRLIVTLLSDALLRNNQGQFSAAGNLVVQAISSTLKCEVRLDDSFVRGLMVGGFNRKWGLPLPQALAMVMGSVFVCSAPTCREEDVRVLEAKGIGERRAEGFGRIAVNWQNRPQWALPETKAAKQTPPLGRLEPASESARVALRMADRMLRNRLDAGLAARAIELSGDLKRVSKSQLARLRLVLHDALNQQPSVGRERLLRYLDDLERRQAARKQFARERIGGRPMLEWLRQRIKDQTDLWSVLQVEKAPEVGGVSAALSEDLAYEYSLRLIDAVLARAAKVR